jgi:Fe-S-cluster containining protein
MTMSPEMKKMIEAYGAEPLEAASTFTFECQPSCWGTCCKGIDIILSPHDIYQMARGLGKSMKEFLLDHCDVFAGGQSKFPIARLRDAANGSCEFLETDGKCGARDSRPSVCRSSPLGRAMGSVDPNGTDEEHIILTLPHPKCQKQNATPATRQWTAEEYLQDNDVRTWWNGSDPYYDLSRYALQELEFPKWATYTTLRVLTPFLFCPDQLVPPGTAPAEMLRRGIEASRQIMTSIAAGYGYGPLKDGFTLKTSLKGAIMAQQIMKNGCVDEAIADIESETVIEDKALFPGFTVVDPRRETPLLSLPSFQLEDGKLLVEFLDREAKAMQPLYDWVVILSPDATKTSKADVLLRSAKMAAMKRSRSSRRFSSGI